MAVIAMLPCTAPVASERVTLVVAGQSNASGVNRLGDLPTTFPINANRLALFGNDWAWREAREPIDDPRDQPDVVSRDSSPGVGPGLAMADLLVELRPSWSIALVPAAMSGTPARRWLPAYGGEELYGLMLAKAAVAAHHYSDRVILLWYQGESDSLSEEDASQYADRVDALWSAFERDIGKPVTVAFVQLPELRPTGPRWVAWERVREGQELLRGPGRVMVTAPSGPYTDGSLHLATEAQLALGEELARSVHGSIQ